MWKMYFLKAGHFSGVDKFLGNGNHLSSELVNLVYYIFVKLKFWLYITNFVQIKLHTQKLLTKYLYRFVSKNKMNIRVQKYIKTVKCERLIGDDVINTELRLFN